MIFDIFYDSGDIVRGTVIPDSYSGSSRIRVFAGGKEVGVFLADELNQGVRETGIHETGLVNFSITKQLLPGLPTFRDLEIREVETNLLLYRRLQPSMLAQKYLRLETHLLPLWRLDEAVKPRFQQYYKGIEALGRSGTTQVFHLSQPSIYASGRILIENFKFCFGNGFKLVVMLHDPYEELAERLLVLNKIATMNPSPFGEREIINLRGAIEYAATLPFDNEKALKRALLQMPLDVIMSLANPVVRQLSTLNLGDQPTTSGVASALDVLGQATVVGLRSEPEQFVKALGELFGVDAAGLPIAPRFPKVIEFAEMLRSWGCYDSILEKDLELYALVLDAHQKSGAQRRADESVKSNSQ